MVVITYLLRRRADVPADQFHRYWREEHGPLVAKQATALGIRRYMQLHALASSLDDALRASRGCDNTEYDGVALAWFDSADALVAAATSPVGRNAVQLLLEDEHRFIDQERSAIWLSEDVPVIS